MNFSTFRAVTLTVVLSFASFFASAEDSTQYHIIPKPVSLAPRSGHFTLGTGSSLSAPAELTAAATWFSGQLASMGAATIPVKKSGGNIHLILIAAGSDSLIGKEGYHLLVESNGVTLKANTPAGIFTGLQSLLQLMPARLSSSFAIPNVVITDYPRFGWRGLMLDVSRHFFSMDEVKKYLDNMVRYKFNVLHLHLSDDQGWRIEIKSLPELTRVGGFRVKRTGPWGQFVPALSFEKATDGGFYTQDQIKDLVKYAAGRNVTILPEIDVPAHSLAMISAYPNLSCTQLPYSVNAGFRSPSRDDNALCIGNDSVFQVLDKVFTELAALFPCEYIHIGGDEAYKGFWADCPKCKKRMETEHLKDVDELQSYFVKRMETILKSHGKKLIGWDEILEGGLAPEATVMSWRGMQGGITAARMNHHVVMTPWDYCYLDLYQGERTAEPTTYGLCRLKDSYTYDPVPDSVDEKFILGGQGNQWTERIPNFRHLEYMAYPRAQALSEVYWSPKASRNWDDFTGRLEKEFEYMDVADIKYARSAFNVIVTPIRVPGKDFEVKLSTEINGLDIYYTFDETNPDSDYPKYSGTPIRFPIGASQLSIITYRKGKPVGKQVNVKKDDLTARLLEQRHVY